MKIVKIIRQTLVFTVTISVHQFAFNQQIKTYNGPYQWGPNNGVAQYNYYEQDSKRILHGAFKFSYELKNYNAEADSEIIGQFKNGEVDGTWTSKANIIAKNQRFVIRDVGNFSNGIADGRFVKQMKFEAGTTKDSVSTYLTFNKGKPNGKFVHYDGIEKIRLISEFSPNGLLIGESKYYVSNEEEITVFNNDNKAILVQQFLNGKEVKRIDVLEKIKTIEPKYSSWDTVTFKKGSEILESFWTDGNWGHFSGIGSFTTNGLSDFKYLQFQKLVSFEDADFWPIQEWRQLNSSLTLSHEENNKLFERWEYYVNNKSQPSNEERKFFIQEDLKSYDSVNLVFKNINFVDLTKSYNDLTAKITTRSNDIMNAYEEIKKIKVLFEGNIRSTQIAEFKFEKIPADPFLIERKSDLDSLSEIIKQISIELNKPYKLSEWDLQMARLITLKKQVPLQNDNRLSEYSSNLSNWIKGDFLIYIKNNEQIINITSNEKEFDDLNRVYKLVAKHILDNINVLSLNDLLSTTTNLNRLQNKILEFINNPAEAYKPIRRNLKKAEEISEILLVLEM